MVEPQLAEAITFACDTNSSRMLFTIASRRDKSLEKPPLQPKGGTPRTVASPVIISKLLPKIMNRMSSVVALLLVACCFLPTPALAAPAADGITFAVESKKIYLALEEATRHLGWEATIDEKRDRVTLNGKTLSLRKLIDGTRLVSLTELEKAGATLSPIEGEASVKVEHNDRYLIVVPGEKRAEVNLATQRLRAWQGERLILETRVSSGRRGRTPSGSFTAGPYKARRHYSSRYNNAAMPYSVQVTGNFFIHGFTSVPKYPASHGCIRVPLTEGNPAKLFYEWVSKGTPIEIVKK